MPNPIDLERFRDCSDGTAAGLEELADLFLAHIAETAEALHPAVRDAQADVIQAVAHKGAGAAGACGARHLRELLTELEMLGAESRLERTPDVLSEIDREVARVSSYLTAARENGFATEPR
jgi:HPt (histidine-containing phosphotransfer) domain-containing protein